MIRTILTPALFAAAFAVSAGVPVAQAQDGCTSGWDFGMVEDEGGPAPLAWVCPIGSEPGLSLRCGKSQHLALSYFEDPAKILRDPDYSGTYSIGIGDDTFRRTMLYQALDGSLISEDQPIDGPLIAAMKRGNDLTIMAKDGLSASFGLEGSAEALEQLVVLCAKFGN